MRLNICHKLHESVDVVLLSPGPLCGTATSQLARHFNLPHAMAAAVLCKGSGPVATQMPHGCAKAAIGMMATLGVRLAMVPVGEEAAPDLFDLCLHLTDLRAAACAEQTLRDLGVWESPDRPDFYGPVGLQITDLCQGLTEATILALGRIAGVEVISCAQSEALYDLFLAPDQTSCALKPQIKHLADMGCHAADPWPALAVGLDRPMLAHFETRFPDHGLICVNQAFQRYDVVLTGLGDVSIRDFVDFLTVRGHTPSVAFNDLMYTQGLTIESSLSRKAAEQFVADYTMIGLHVQANFVRAQEKVIKMSQVKPGFIKIA
jgi:hypothetical protein